MKQFYGIEFKQWFETLLFVLIAMQIFLGKYADAGCRTQERNKCEIICKHNSTDDCTLRAIVILPKMDKVEASLPRVILFKC